MFILSKSVTFVTINKTKGHKAFLLPQRDPEQNLLLTKSYNVPELTRDAVTLTADEVKACIYADEKAQKVSYK